MDYSETNYSKAEDKILNIFIERYVIFEKKNDYEKGQPLKFYRMVLSTFEKEKVLNILNKNNYIQSKELYDVRKRFYKNFVDTTSDAKDFHKYFYNKFINEIKDMRNKLYGSPYSKKALRY